MGYQATGIKPGNATITITSKTSPNVKTEVPVTVTGTSRNLLSYGPADPVPGQPDLHVTVTDQGALLLKGTPVKGGALRFALDPTRFTPGGTYTLSQTPAHSSAFNVRAAIEHNNGQQITALWNNDHMTFQMPDPIQTDLRLNIKFDGEGGMSGVEYKPQLEAGDTVSAWVRPDTTDATPVEA